MINLDFIPDVARQDDEIIEIIHIFDGYANKYGVSRPSSYLTFLVQKAERRIRSLRAYDRHAFQTQHDFIEWNPDWETLWRVQSDWE